MTVSFGLGTCRCSGMEQSAIPYRKIAFVCVNRREAPEACCAQRGGEAIAEALKGRVKAAGLARHIRVSKSGCQDVCAKGPSVMVFPDGVWYYGVTLDDIDHIFLDLSAGLV